MRPSILFLCTGNAARSVMAAALLRARTPDLDVVSAGTHSIPGLPMSSRTRSALASLGVSDPDHRSCQVDDAMLASASIVAVFEPMHLKYIRKNHSDALRRTGSLPRLARDLAPGSLETLEERVAALGFEQRRRFEPWEEVVDPAGGDLADFEATAHSIDELITSLCDNLGV